MKNQDNYLAFNLNCDILVKLNKNGFDQWLKWTNKKLPERLWVTIEKLMEQKDNNGYVRMPTWKLMQIFGESLYMGNNNLMFDLNVLFNSSDLINK